LPGEKILKDKKFLESVENLTINLSSSSNSLVWKISHEKDKLT